MARLAEPAAATGAEVFDCEHPMHCLAPASAISKASPCSCFGYERGAQQSRIASALPAPGAGDAAGEAAG